ncbi:N-acetyl-anhydromuranmyl-L-alanine amidase [Xenorhabdus budapestensis]|uniref:N-acetylmuramoyl-L-alanine amidase n=2 Tax=Xenorhabdus budapestensis TaxID=290110 RepID=A0A2D0J469_XENBU|nr:N-acetyl-anhydromuranmyl-L-alanine amidase [Xenorhabdus budapestensis]
MMRKVLIGVFLTLLIGCSYQTPLEERNNYLIDHSYSYSTKQNLEAVKFLVLHYTALNDRNSLRVLTNGNVSVQYLIPSQPKYKNNEPIIFQLSSEKEKAWHAGRSEWRGYKNLNSYSIGIEIVNCGFKQYFIKKEWCVYHSSQIDALIRLAKDIIRRHKIEAVNVVGHSDIAPLRKEDPGLVFPWRELYEQGIGAWPNLTTVNRYLANRLPDTLVPVIGIQKALAAYGYSIPQTGFLDDDTRKTIQVFQMHFRPSDIRGNPDAETEAIALALVEKYK